MGSIEGGEAAERRFDGEGELVGMDMGGSNIPSSGSGEMAKERGMKLSGVLVVRLRARNEALGCCSGRSTAASRWRPPGRLWKRRGCVARPGRLQREEGGRWGGSGATRGCQREAKAKLELAGEAAGGARHRR